MPRPQRFARLPLPLVVTCLLLAAAARARAQGAASPAPVVSRNAGGTRLLSGANYDLGFSGAALFGYESNYTYTVDPHVTGSPLVVGELGISYQHRLSPRLALRAGLAAVARVPTANARLVEFTIEVPAILTIRLSSLVELWVTNHFGTQQSRTPPVFLGTEAITGRQAGTIRFSSLHDTLQPMVYVRLGTSFGVELGPYARIKQVNFLENPVGFEPDYRIHDVGVTAAGRYELGDRFTARLLYDLGKRWFANYEARPPGRNPQETTALGMLRHAMGLRLGVRVVGQLRLQGAYSLRIHRDNGGYFDSLGHVVEGGVGYSIPDRLQIYAGAQFLSRRYTSRTPCEAQPVGPQGPFAGSDCRGPQRALQVLEEAYLGASARVTVFITRWIQAIASYEIADAEADAWNPTKPNHRILGGVGSSL